MSAARYHRRTDDDTAISSTSRENYCPKNELDSIF